MSWDETNRGAFSVAQGWFATAERLLEGREESAEHGRIALTRASNAMFAEGNYPSAIEHFDRAYELARRFGDRDTQMLALAAKGRALMKSGEIEKGLELLDEGSAAAVSGELQAYSTTLVYCMTISSCQDVGDFRRAAEWTEAANRWCDRLDVTGFPGACRIHRAELMRLRGDLEAAEKVAMAACDELHDFERYITALGHYEIGEIRRRLGDFAAADEAYARANELGHDPQPGLALLRLAEGKLDAAVAGISRALEEAEEPFSRLRRLPAQVEIAVAARDLKTARAASAELEQIVDSYKIGGRRAPAFDATVHIAAGRIALAEGDTDEAVRRLRQARDQWREVGAPFETAQARLLLGVAFRRRGDEHAATAELDAAHAAFERIGAKSDAQRAAELLGRQKTRRTFLFTDIVGSTRLLETLGNDKWRKLLGRHNELLEQQIADSGGEVVQKTGDGFFATFATPKAALEAADRHPASARGRDRRAGRQDRSAHRRSVRERRRRQRVRGRSRSRRGADRRGRGGRRDPHESRNPRGRRKRLPGVESAIRDPQGIRGAGRRGQRRLALVARGNPGSPVSPFLAGGRSLLRFQEPPEVFALRAVLVLASLPPGKARLRRQMVAVFENV